MKKQRLTLAMLLFTAGFCLVQAEATYTAGHYSFTYPESFVGIEAVAESFNAYWSAFNEVFRFNPAPGSRINRVVILGDKAAFDAYLTERIGDKRNEYIFLKYAKPELSELVLFTDPNSSDSKSSDPRSSDPRSVPGPAAFYGPVLNRQLFLQYLYSYVSEPPLWIRDGFQAYFEKLTYNPETRTVASGGYSPWLEAAKNLEADPARKLDTAAILSAVTGSYEAARYYPQAWAFVSFLLNTEKGDYQRFVSEACILLEGAEAYNTEAQQANTDLVKNRFSRFNTAEKSDADFVLWLSGQHTFAELLQSGVSLYNAGNYPAARPILLEAVKIRSEDPILSYYLGLTAYAEKDYPTADLWYQKALKNGADPSTVNWALGLNAFASKRYAESRVYLETAKSVNPARYAEKAAKLINSMPK